MHVKDTVVHANDICMHAKNIGMHAKDTGMHAKDIGMHAKNENNEPKDFFTRTDLSDNLHALLVVPTVRCLTSLTFSPLPAEKDVPLPPRKRTRPAKPAKPKKQLPLSYFRTTLAAQLFRQDPSAVVPQPTVPKKKPAPNRRKIGKRGRPSKQRLEELFGPHHACQDRIEQLKAELEEAKRQVAVKEREKELLCVQLAAKEVRAREPSTARQIIGVLRRTGLEIRRPALKTALLLRAETLADMADVQAHLNVLHNLPSQLRRDRLLKAQSHTARAFRDNVAEDKKKTEFAPKSLYSVLVLGHDVLRSESARMAFWANSDLDLAGARVICAFADGKFSGCPRGWTQLFQLRLLVERRPPNALNSPTQTTVTFALALLDGKTEDFYFDFFAAVKNAGCPTPPFLLTDFELAIGRGAKKVWPALQLRGCYFHFLANLTKKIASLQRWLGKTASIATVNLLTVSPLLSVLPFYLHTRIQQLQLVGDALFKDINFKLIMYVFATYAVRLRGLFAIDLGELLSRTNNTCEGLNSGIQRKFSVRLSDGEIRQLVEETFKTDLVRPWHPPRLRTANDDFLDLLQTQSRTKPQQILDFLASRPKIIAKFAPDLLRALKPLVLLRGYRVCEEREHAATANLMRMKAEYWLFRENRKAKKVLLQKAIEVVMREDGMHVGSKSAARDQLFLESSDLDADSFDGAHLPLCADDHEDSGILPARTQTNRQDPIKPDNDSETVKKILNLLQKYLAGRAKKLLDTGCEDKDAHRQTQSTEQAAISLN